MLKHGYRTDTWKCRKLSQNAYSHSIVDVHANQCVSEVPSDGGTGELLASILRMVRVMEGKIQEEWVICS